MAVFNLIGFTAEAEVLGKLRHVQYSDGLLRIDDLDLSEAKAAIDRLSVGLAVTTLGGQEQTLGPTSEEEAERETPPTEQEAPAKAPAPAPAKKSAGKPKKVAEPVAVPQQEEQKPQKGNGPDLAGMSKLKDVVEALIAAGFADKAAVLKRCEEIKNEVPVLKRISNIPDRIERIFERMRD